jgi:fibronectin-binding autotransporter adhesin
MKRIYRPGLNRAIALAAAAVSQMALLSPVHAQAVTFLDLSGGLTGWTTAGTVSVMSTTDAYDINGSPYSLTPAAGDSMAKISPENAAIGSVDSLLGLSANSIESLVNNSNGHVTNFGFMTQSFSFNPGTYEFSWAYAATDYVPFNDGVLFSVVGDGTQSVVSLARNGSGGSDTSGPSPGTLILGSYGTVPWQTATFTVATAGTYQVSFADYNWDDTALDPIFYVSGTAGGSTGAPPPITGGGPTLVIGTTGGDVSASVFDTASTAYNQPALTFDGGTLQYGANTVTSVDGALTSNGGTIDTQTYSVNYSGALSGVGGLTVMGSGALALSAVNSYAGATVVNSGATLALTGVGSIAASSGIADNGTFDISATNSGASVQSLSGGAGGLVALGNQTLTLTNAADIFSGSIAGAGGLTIGGGTETLAGTNSYTGATTIADGATLALSGTGSIAASGSVSDNGIFDISATTSGASIQSLSGGAGGLVMLGGQTLTLTNAADTFSGSIAGTGGLTISGGAETLEGTNTYTRATTIAGGATLALSGAGSIAASSGVGDNGTFDISATTSGAAVQSLSGSVGGLVVLGSQTLNLTNASDAFAGNIVGAGGLTISGGAESLEGTNSYTGATTIGGGATLALLGAGTIATSSGVADNGTFDITGTISGAAVQSLSGGVGGSVVLGNNTLQLTNANDTFGGSIGGSGGVTVSGGSETLSGANAYTGATSVGTGGALALIGAGSIAASSGIADNGTFDISGTTAGASVQTLSGAGIVALGNQTLALTNAHDTFSGAIGGSGGLTVGGGTETLTGANGYGGATTIGGGATLALSGAGAIAASSGIADNGTFDVSGTPAGASVQTLSGAGTVALGGQTLTLTQAADTFSGGIAGTGALIVSSGAETLSGTNSYSGATTINSAATLALSGAGSIAASSGIAANGNFDISGTAAGASVQTLSGVGTVALGGQTLALTNANDTFGGSIGGSGGVTVSGGSETLSGTNAYTGATSVGTGGKLVLSGAGSIGTSSVLADNGHFSIAWVTSGASLMSLSGNGLVALGTQNLTLTNANDTFAGSIGGSGCVTVSGGSELLSGANTYTGCTAVGSGASLTLIGAGSIAASNGIADNGTFDISSAAAVQSLTGGAGGLVVLGNNTLAITNANGTFAGSIAGSGGLTVSGGTATLTGASGYSGATTIGSGATLALSGAGSIAASSGIADNGNFDISGTAAGASVQTLSGAGTVTLGGQTLALTSANDTFGGSIGGSGGVTVRGGSETLSGANAYTGVTSVGTGGALALSGAGSIETSSALADNGHFSIAEASAGASLMSLSGNGLVALGTQNLTLTNANGTFAGSIGGSGCVIVTGGSESLSGANTYTGCTVVAPGASLALTGAGGISASSGVADNGTLNISGTTAGASVQTLSGAGIVALGNQTLALTNAHDTFTGAIGGSGSLTVGSGSETLSGALGYTGVTSIGAGGTLALTGVSSIAASSGVVDNGSFDIAGVTAGAFVKTLSGNGAVALGAQSLTLTNASGTFAGSINGSGGVNLSGGVETLTGVSSYTGGTMVTGASKLVIASDAALGANSGTLTLNNSTLENTASITSARNVNLVGAVNFLNDPGTSFEMNGQISGAAAVTKNGDGTLVLGGDNQNWGLPGDNLVGGLTVNAGLVEVTNAYGLGYGPVVVNGGVIATTVNILTAQTIQIDGNTVLNTDAGTTTTLTGTVLTGGNGSCFDKTGAGTLVISGTATLDNGTCVEEGKLSVNGTLNSTITVAPDGMLRGTGLINGPVAVRGTLAAGNSPGTLTVGGTVTMEGGSTYQEDINGTGKGAGPGNYSRLLVAGATSQFIASGATLNVNLLNITGTSAYTPYVPKFGDTFAIITAAGGIVGKFATFDQPAGLASGTRLDIFYDYLGNDSIDLRLVPKSYATALEGSGIDSNARSAGGALDRIVATDQAGAPTAAQNALSYEISGLTAAQLPGAMTALAGEIHADLAAIAPQADQWLQGSIERQLESGSAIDSTGAPLPGHALWLDTSANYGKWSGDDRAAGFSDDHTQVAVGIELLADQPSRLGIGFSHALADVSTLEASGSEESNTGFVYGQYSLGPAVLDGMLGAGGDSWESTRVDPLSANAQDLRASGHGTSSLAGAGVRWPLPVGDMVVQPYARLLWQRSARGSFDEGTSPDALSAPSYAATGLRSLAGISAGSANGSPLAANFTYRVNLGIGYDGGDLVHPAVSQTLAGDSFTVQAPDVSRTFAQLNLTGTARIAKRAYVYVGLSDEARGGKSQEEGVTAGARANF